MKAIYSLSIGKNGVRNNEFCGYKCKEDLLDALLLSSSISAKHFDKIELYCDTEAAELIKEDGRVFPLDIIICLDDLQWVNGLLWAYSKVFVYSLQKEPFLHIDIDAILWDGLPEELTTQKFIFQQKEPVNGFYWYNEIFKEAEILNVLPSKISYKPEYALNTAVFACTDINYLYIIKQYFSVVNSYISNVKDKLSEFKCSHAQCILFEQLFLVNILETAGLKFGVDYDTILHDDSSEKWNMCKYTHLIVGSKRDENNVNRIKKQLKIRGLIKTI